MLKHLLVLITAALMLSACGEQESATLEDATAPVAATAPPDAGESMANGDDDDARTGDSASFTVDYTYHTLDNGLKVVLSEDDVSPVVTVAVYYNIGFRNEPRDRTGFAHLFEHMMFQGSNNLGKNEFIGLVQANGGVLNGSTRYDFTNYFEIVPAHKLETMLWAEADRMSGLAITQDNLTNQQGVVKNEVKVNVLNQPYGGFPWLDMPQYANENWYNSHNFYGELEDLDAATLTDVADFFEKFYSPNNAAVVVVGDFDSDEALAWIEEYFADIPASESPIVQPDISEPRQEAEKTFSRNDPLATRPGFAFAYHMPERLTPEWYAMGLLDQILIQGNDSLLYQAFVQDKGYTGSINGGINPLGSMLNYKGPMLWSGSFIHDSDVSRDEIVAVLNDVIEGVRTEAVDEATLDRALIKWRSAYYDQINASFGFGRADLLASLALFDDNPGLVNEFEAGMAAVTADQVLAAAQEYLRPTNRTTLVLEAGAATDDESDEAATETEMEMENNNG